MLRTLSGTISVPGGGTLQSGILKATPVGTMPTGSGGALAPVPKVYAITDGAISGSIDGDVEYVFEVLDGNLRTVVPDFRATIANIDQAITWADIYASANVHVPVDMSVPDLIAQAIAEHNDDEEAHGPAGPGGGVSSHSDLEDLGADDHPQYYNQARGDARYSQIGHTHSISHVANLQTTLDGKASTASVTSEATARTTADNALDTRLDAAESTIASHSTEIAGKIPTTEKAAANGVATLDETGKLPSSQLPSAAVGGLAYQGTWTAATNTPAIPAAASGNAGHYYKVATEGTTSIDGVTDWKVGDWVISDGTAWAKVDNTDQVTSVAGRQGAITLGISDIASLQTALDAKLASATAATTYAPLARAGFMLDPRSAPYNATPGDRSTPADAPTKAANAAALQQCFVDAHAQGLGVWFGAGYWCAKDVLNWSELNVRVEGLGFLCGIFTDDTTGTLINARQPVGGALQAIQVHGVAIRGPIGADETITLLKLGRETEFVDPENALSTYLIHLENCHVFGGDIGVDVLNSNWVRMKHCFVEHARTRVLRHNNQQNSDWGDSFYSENHFHSRRDGMAGWDPANLIVTEFVSVSGLYHWQNKYYCGSDVTVSISNSNTAFGVDDHPQIEQIHMMNQFDSGGLVLNSTCIQYRSNFDAGEANGNRVYGITIAYNFFSNCARALDIECNDYAFTHLDISKNRMNGGGSFRFAGEIGPTWITGNKFDRNLNDGSAGPWAPDRAILSSATFSHRVVSGNDIRNYSVAPDFDNDDADAGDMTPVTRDVAIAANVATITPVTANRPDAARVVIDDDVALTFVSLVDGDHGVVLLPHSGDGHAVTLGAAPDGFTIGWVADTAGTFAALDDYVDVLHWRASAGVLSLRLENLGEFPGITSEGPSSFDPTTDIPDAIAVYHAPLIAGFANNDPLSAWEDPVGSHDLAQATLGNRPTYLSAGIGGGAAVEFDGGDDEMTVTNYAFGSDFTAYAVVDPAADNNTVAAIRYFIGGSPEFGLIVGGASFNVGEHDGANFRQSNAAAPTTPMVICWQPGYISINGVEVSYANTQTLAGMSMSTMGRRVGVASTFFKGRVGGFYVANTIHDSTVRDAVVAGLMEVFSIAA